MHLGIVVERADAGEELLLADALGELFVHRVEANLGGRLLLHAHVRAAVRPVAHEDHSQARGDAVLTHKLLGELAYLLSDLLGDGLAIDHAGSARRLILWLRHRHHTS